MISIMSCCFYDDVQDILLVNELWVDGHAINTIAKISVYDRITVIKINNT